MSQDEDRDVEAHPASLSDEKQDFRDASASTPSVEPAPAQKVPVFPDGGLQAWIVVLGAACVFFTTFGQSSHILCPSHLAFVRIIVAAVCASQPQTNSFGAFEDYYVRIYLSNKSAADISWIGSVQLFFQSALGLVSGAAFDRGYFYHVVGAGGVLYIFCMFMLSLAQPHQYYQAFLAQGVGMGIALGLIFVPTLSVISHYFRRRRATALGLAFAGTSVGGVCLPIMINRLLNGPVGFGNGVRAMAGLTAGLFAIGVFLVRPRPPSEISFGGPKAKMDVKAYIQDVPYMMVWLGSFFGTLGMWIPMTYLQLDATRHGIDSNFAFYVPTILNAASFFGRLFPNMIADKIGALTVLVITGLSCSFICLGMLGVSNGNVGAVAAIAITYGFFSGANISLWGAVIPEFCPSLQELGARSGFLYIGVGIAGLLGNPIGGSLLTSEYHWWRLILWSVITIQASVWCLLLANFLRKRKLRRQLTAEK